MAAACAVGAPAAAAAAHRSLPAALCLPCRRQHVPGSPRASHGALLEGPPHPLLPVRTGVDARRMSSLQEELGDGEGVSSLLARSAVAGEGGGPGVVQQAESDVNGGGVVVAAAQLFSPPNSPRRRQTTFGATLDFVETLCQASSSLTAFPRACCCHSLPQSLSGCVATAAWLTSACLALPPTPTQPRTASGHWARRCSRSMWRLRRPAATVRPAGRPRAQTHGRRLRCCAEPGCLPAMLHSGLTRLALASRSPLPASPARRGHLVSHGV